MIGRCPSLSIWKIVVRSVRLSRRHTSTQYLGYFHRLTKPLVAVARLHVLGMPRYSRARAVRIFQRRFALTAEALRTGDLPQQPYRTSRISGYSRNSLSETLDSRDKTLPRGLRRAPEGLNAVAAQRGSRGPWLPP